LVALQPRDLTADMSRLVVGDKALDWLRRELARFQDFLRETVAMQRDVLVGVTAADGGLTADGLLERLDEERWTEFQSRFLRA
jgi:hypothetical protein